MRGLGMVGFGYVITVQRSGPLLAILRIRNWFPSCGQRRSMRTQSEVCRARELPRQNLRAGADVFSMLTRSMFRG